MKLVWDYSFSMYTKFSEKPAFTRGEETLAF